MTSFPGDPPEVSMSGPKFPVAASHLTTSSAGIRPRSLTSMPWALATHGPLYIGSRSWRSCACREPSPRGPPALTYGGKACKQDQGGAAVVC